MRIKSSKFSRRLSALDRYVEVVASGHGVGPVGPVVFVKVFEPETGRCLRLELTEKQVETLRADLRRQLDAARKETGGA